ncbi:UNVERIFIED_CONTAM: hypothetical protein FKN15_000616 [Acipenser sinensis]
MYFCLIKVEPPEPEPVCLKQEPEPAHTKEDLLDPVHLKEEAGELRLVHVKVETAEDHAQEDPFDPETVHVKTEEESEDVSEEDRAETSQGCIAESMNDLGPPQRGSGRAPPCPRQSGDRRGPCARGPFRSGNGPRQNRGGIGGCV